ncbi:MAG: CsbD family protein, partial [Chromatiales bacterium]|nr:CsbD family protein [Chromatiales bacterium]
SRPPKPACDSRPKQGKMSPVPGQSGAPFFHTLTERKMSSGTADKMQGKLKEAGGVLLDDDKMKAEGKAQQATGSVKDAIESISDSASDLVDKAADLLKGK